MSMQTIMHKLHDNPGKILDCECDVKIELDDETAAFCFPQLETCTKPEPSVFVTLDGTKVKVVIGCAEGSEWAFTYCESDGKWYGGREQ